MNFFRRNFTMKVMTLLGVVIAACGGAVYFLSGKFGLTFFSIEYVYWMFVGIFVVLSFVFWFSVSRPLRDIIMQMQALLTGREYKKFYTDRIDEVGVMAHFFNQITKSLDRFSGDVETEKRMASELGLASSLQKSILPTRAPSVPGLLIAVKNRSAAEIGGDSFGFLSAKGAEYMYIGDATGHGVSAGIVMTIVHTLVTVYSEIARSAQELMYHVNRQLKQKIQRTLFMTMMMLKWDTTTNVMSYVGAGHEYIIVYSMKTGRCEATVSGGIALGMVPDNSKMVKEEIMPFEKGDIIFLYTDGVTEAKNVSGELFGLDRLKDAIPKYASQYEPAVALDKLMADIDSFMTGTVQADDITIIAIQRVVA